MMRYYGNCVHRSVQRARGPARAPPRLATAASDAVTLRSKLWRLASTLTAEDSQHVSSGRHDQDFRGRCRSSPEGNRTRLSHSGTGRLTEKRPCATRWHGTTLRDIEAWAKDVGGQLLKAASRSAISTPAGLARRVLTSRTRTKCDNFQRVRQPR